MHDAISADRVTPGSLWTTDGNFARIVTVISVDPELGTAKCRDDEDGSYHVETIEHIALKWSTRTGAYDARRAAHQQALRAGRRPDAQRTRKLALELAAITMIVSEGEAP